MSKRKLCKVFLSFTVIILGGLLFSGNIGFVPSVVIAQAQSGNQSQNIEPAKVIDEETSSAKELNSNGKQKGVLEFEMSGTPLHPEGTSESDFFDLHPLTSPENLISSIYYFNDEHSAPGTIPSDAYVTDILIWTRIDDSYNPVDFYCFYYEIWLGSGSATMEHCIYDNLGGKTDGGFDDDSEDDASIDLYGRSTHYFNGEDPTQKWWVVIKNTATYNTGRVNHISLKIYWETPPCNIHVVAPNGGEELIAGSPYLIRWDTGTPSGNVKIEYLKGTIGVWQTIVSSTPDDGSYNWVNIPYGINSSYCTIQISDVQGGCYDRSDDYFTIKDPCEITVTSPNGGEIWEGGSTHNIRWTSSGTSGNVTIKYTPNYGVIAFMYTIVSSTPDDGSYSWKLPTDIYSTGYRVKVIDVVDSDCNDISNDNFTIKGPCSITVTSPNGGETWEAGSTHNITWTSDGTSGNVKIEYSTNGGSSWQMIASSAADDGSKHWNIPANINSTQCRVKITDVSNNSCYDVSDANFTIGEPTTPSITIISPNGGETWQSPSTQNITWSSTNTSGSVRIEYTTNYNGIPNWIAISKSVADNGSISWDIPADINSMNCRIRISDVADASIFDTSDANFKISTGVFDNLLVNGDFSEGDTGWKFSIFPPAQATGSVVNGEYFVSITHGGTEIWYVKLSQPGLLIEEGKKYIISFEAYATDSRRIALALQKGWTGEWTGYHYQFFNITTEKRKYKCEFKMNQPTDQNAIFYFDLGKSTENVYLDNVILREKQITGKLENGDFSNGDEYWVTWISSEASGYGSVQNGEYLLSIDNGGSQSYHVQLMQTDLLIEQGKKYTVSLDAYAERPRKILVSVGQSYNPWWSYHSHQTINLTTTWQTFGYSFTMIQPTDSASRFLFDCGLSALDVHFDNVVLIDEGSNMPLYQNNFDQSLTNTSEPELALPTAYRLLQSHPNPFNLETTIGYHLPQPAEVVLTIYNSQGHEVRQLVHHNHAAGIHYARWDGRNEIGQVVASGLYFYRLEARPTEAGQHPFVEMKKMILMK